MSPIQAVRMKIQILLTAAQQSACKLAVWQAAEGGWQRFESPQGSKTDHLSKDIVQSRTFAGPKTTLPTDARRPPPVRFIGHENDEHAKEGPPGKSGSAVAHETCRLRPGRMRGLQSRLPKKGGLPRKGKLPRWSRLSRPAMMVGERRLRKRSSSATTSRSQWLSVSDFRRSDR